nr:LysE family translocator [Vibrio tasmaniensis]
MSITSGIALFVAMLLSVAIPGPSVLAVLSRSLSYGWKQGLLVVLGVLIADYIFIFLALSGLSALASAMGEFATVIKYVGVTYLFWLAYTTWTSDVSESSSTSSEQGTKASSVTIGLLMTVSNPKAILYFKGAQQRCY